MAGLGGMVVPIVIVVAFLLVVTLLRELVRIFLRRSVLPSPCATTLTCSGPLQDPATRQPHPSPRPSSWRARWSSSDRRRSPTSRKGTWYRSPATLPPVKG